MNLVMLPARLSVHGGARRAARTRGGATGWTGERTPPRAGERTAPEERECVGAGRVGPALALLAVVALLWGAAGCGKPQPYGNPDSVIVAMSDTLWQEVEDTTYAALERRVEAVRRERQYRVTHVDAGEERWQQLRLWYQVVVAGPPEDGLVQQVARKAGVSDPTAPSVLSAGTVWSRGQVVYAVVLDPRRPAESWREQLPELYARVDSTYRTFVRERMWVSGRDSVRLDSLRQKYGFRIDAPAVYTITEHDSVVIVRNDNPSPQDLIRQVTVAWRRPPLDSLTHEAAYRWRAALDSVYFGTPQAISRQPETVRRFEHHGREALEVRGDWSDEGPYPAGGPFTVWLVQCPGRTFYLGSWLYSPNPERGKYQHLLQLRWIRRSFRCPAEGTGPGPGDSPGPGDTGESSPT